MIQDKLLILDFGSQVTDLIARRLREAHVYCEVWAYDASEAAIRAFAPKAIILSGSHASTYEAQHLRAPGCVFTLGVPVLGICYGMFTLCEQLGGQVAASRLKEFGAAQLRIAAGEDWLGDLGAVWMSHGDKVERVPPGFHIAASTENCPVAAMADAARRFYGIQFHPEVTHTQRGGEFLRHFACNIAGIAPDWRMSNYLEESLSEIRSQVGADEVILGLSGGVDSSVAAALIHRAIGAQLTCVFVDHGLLRAEEAENLRTVFAEQLHAKVVMVNAAERFLKKLQGVSDPERKRKIIGAEFVAVFEEEAARLENAKWLAQGTIYPDVIESGKARAGLTAAIKSHHNVGGLPEHLGLKLLEPLRRLFKDEVRELGRTLGLPESMIGRHPFPGPGLGVRILGEVKREYVDILRAADAIFLDELLATRDESGVRWYERVAQAFAVFLPVRTTGVKGDGRAYEYVVSLRAVTTTDFMTADWAALPDALLRKTSSRILNEVPHVTRVTYDISSKPPATIEWE